MDFQDGEIPDLIERDISIPLKLRVKRGISIIGPRRAGKTYFMFNLIRRLLMNKIGKDRVLYINLEDFRFEGVSYKDLMKFIDVYYDVFPRNRRVDVWFFFDEVQNISNWEKFIRGLIDKEKVQVFVSGSSSKLLSREIATGLRGRTLSSEVYPFSFKEFLRAKGFGLREYLSSYDKNTILNLLDEYMRWGGYPEVVIEKRMRSEIIREIWEVTIARDIVDRWGIRNIKVLRLLIKALRSSKILSIHRFYNYLRSMGIKLGKNILYNYLEYLYDAFIVFSLRRFSYSYKNIEMSIPKIYFVDNGLYLGEKDLGRLMENLIFIELKRRGYRENENIFYWRDQGGKEVDFIIKNSGFRQLIQVCYEITLDNERREINSLISASRELDCKDLLVITWDQEYTIEKDGRRINVIPLWKWLLKVIDSSSFSGKGIERRRGKDVFDEKP